MNFFCARVSALRQHRFCAPCIALVAQDMLNALTGLRAAERVGLQTTFTFTANPPILPFCAYCRRKAMRPLCSLLQETITDDYVCEIAELLAQTDFGDLTADKYVFALICYARRAVASRVQEKALVEQGMQTEPENLRDAALANYLARLYGINAFETKKMLYLAKDYYEQAKALYISLQLSEERQKDVLRLQEQCNTLLKENLEMRPGRISRPYSAGYVQVKNYQRPCSANVQINQSFDNQKASTYQRTRQPINTPNVSEPSGSGTSKQAYYQQFKRLYEAKHNVPQISKKIGLLYYENEMLRQYNTDLMKMLEQQGFKMPLECYVELLSSKLNYSQVEMQKFKAAYMDLCKQVFLLRYNKEIAVSIDQRYLQYYTNIFNNVVKDLANVDYMSFQYHCDLVRRYVLYEYVSQFVAYQTKMTETALRLYKVYSALYEQYLFMLVKGIPAYANCGASPDFALFWDVEGSFAYKLNCVLAVLSIYGYVAAQINGYLVLVQGQ